MGVLGQHFTERGDRKISSPDKFSELKVVGLSVGSEIFEFFNCELSTSKKPGAIGLNNSANLFFGKRLVF